jgi:hypothetical protein
MWNWTPAPRRVNEDAAEDELTMSIRSTPGLGDNVEIFANVNPSASRVVEGITSVTRPDPLV